MILIVLEQGDHEISFLDVMVDSQWKDCIGMAG